MNRQLLKPTSMSRPNCVAAPARDPERLRRKAEAAHSHFNALGLERASFDAIAADAGVSKLTIYSHFASEEGLFEAVIQDRTDR